MGGKHMFEREDVKVAVGECSQHVNVNDLFVVLKTSNKSGSVSGVWTKVLDWFDEWMKDLSQFSHVRGYILGIDAFESGYPHLNVVVLMNGDYHYDVIRDWSYNKWHNLSSPWEGKSQSSNWQQVSFSKKKFNTPHTPLTLVGYLFRRALEHRWEIEWYRLPFQVLAYVNLLDEDNARIYKFKPAARGKKAQQE